MRGSPLLHCLIGAIAFALFAIPLARLTAKRTDALPVKQTSEEKSEPTDNKHSFIRIRFAHKPKSISLKQGDRELIPVTSTTLPSPIEIEASLPIAQGSVELALVTQWPEGTPDTAITVELEPDELDSRHETRWSGATSLNAILNFKW